MNDDVVLQTDGGDGGDGDATYVYVFILQFLHRQRIKMSLLFKLGATAVAGAALTGYFRARKDLFGELAKPLSSLLEPGMKYAEATSMGTSLYNNLFRTPSRNVHWVIDPQRDRNQGSGMVLSYNN